MSLLELLMFVLVECVCLAAVLLFSCMFCAGREPC
jgi:hypothetical protein